MQHISSFKVAVFVLLLGIGVAGTLSACTIDTGWHHDREDHSGLYR